MIKILFGFMLIFLQHQSTLRTCTASHASVNGLKFNTKPVAS